MTKRLKELSQVNLIEILGNILDINIIDQSHESFLSFSWLEFSNMKFILATLNLLRQGSFDRFEIFKTNEAITSGAVVRIETNFQRFNFAKLLEKLFELLVTNTLLNLSGYFDEDIVLH